MMIRMMRVFDKSSSGDFSNGEDKIDGQSNGLENGKDVKGDTANGEIMNSQSFDEENFTVENFQPIGESLLLPPPSDHGMSEFFCSRCLIAFVLGA